MIKSLLSLLFIIHISLLNPLISLASQNITPYKFTDSAHLPSYNIPASSRFTINRFEAKAPKIVYYLSRPVADEYPVAIICTGSSTPENISSIIHVHRYFLQEFMDLDIGVLSVEQWGVDGNKINKTAFMKNYTRSQRLKDHKAVIEHLKLNPPAGWNGKLIFLGISEGGPIVTTLTQDFADLTLATINWCGAGDWPWREELWVFLQKLLIENPECPHSFKLVECKDCLKEFKSRRHYDDRMNNILNNPTADQYFLNMTYKYHADALDYPPPDYNKIRTPFLVVAGVQDTIIASSDAFVRKATEAGVNITYLRILDMDHYIRKRPDIIKKSFEWLEKQVN